MKNFILFLLVITSCFFSGCKTSSKNVLHVFIWSEYLKPNLIEQFEKEYDCEVVIDTFDSNETMYAKLKLGDGGYDLVFPSNYFIEIMQPQGMLQKLDKNKIENLKNLDTSYLTKVNKELLDNGVPYMISSSGIIYRKDKIPNFDPSWDIFSNSAYKGRMTMLNDSREVFAAALSYLGLSINTTNEEEIQKATDQILNWKKNLAKFESEQYKNGVASAEYILAQGYNGDSLQVIQEIANVSFAYPKEGISLSIDFAAVPSNATNSDLAYAFINFLLRPEVAAENMEYTRFLSPNKPAYALLPETLASNPVMFIPQDVFDKAELIQDLGKNNSLYNKAWDRIKTE